MTLLAALFTGIVAGILLGVVVRRFNAALANTSEGHHCEPRKGEAIQKKHVPHQNGIASSGRFTSFLTMTGRNSFAIIVCTITFSVLAAWVLGEPLQIAAALIFIYLLIAMTFIDIEHQILPDTLTIPLIIIGLAVNFTGIFVEFPMALLGTVLGYGILWTVNTVFRLVRKKEGMGYGDFKLLAALGAWVGAMQLLPIILVSSVLAIIAAVVMRLTKGQDFSIPIPFGPFLALAGFLSLLWGNAALEWYINLLRYY